MKKVNWRMMLVALTAVAAVAGGLPVAYADGTAQAPNPAAAVSPAAPGGVPKGVSPYTETQIEGNDFDKWCECIKKPCDWFCWGADFQIRNVYANNTKTIIDNAPNHEYEYMRYRARVWGTFNLTEDIEFNARFQWEAFNNYEPEGKESQTLSQGLFDNLNFKFKNLCDKQATLTVGRQDIFLGDGWLVADGTPFDGSLTGFFDAARLTYTCENSPTTVDLIFIDNHANPDKWLKPIDNQPFPNAEQDEKGFIAYFTNKSVENTDISPYFMYKKASTLDNLFVQQTNIGEDGANFGYNAELYTPGLRVAHKVDENWRWRAEAAYQFGNSDKADPGHTHDVGAWGANTAVQYFTNDTMNNIFRLQYEYLSGDEPGSSRYEGFDVLWGRWARWSDLYADTTALEQRNRLADFSNLHRVGPGWTFSPCDKIDIATDYYLLFADQSANVDSLSVTNPQAFSNNGFFRGQLITSVLSYKLNKHVSGHLQGELMFPGNYYASDRADVVSFLRYQLVLTF
jgi:hypothetical protein